MSTQVIAQADGHPKTYYINSSGNDANVGTRTMPFKTLNKITRLQLMAGDTVYLKSGQAFDGSLLLIGGIHGTAKRPVVITSYGKGYATINAKDSIGIEINEGSFIKLQRLRLTGSGRKTGNIKDGIAINNSNHISVTDLNISGFQKSGLLIYASQYIMADKIFVHDNGSAGITVEGPYQKRDSHDIQILNCRAENNPGDPTNLTNHSGNGIIVGDCKNVLIDHCTATNNGWDMPRIGNGPVGIWAYEADAVIIQYCLAYRNKTAKGAADGGGFDFDGGVTNSVVQYCMSYQNQGSGYCLFQYSGASPWHDNIFRYNISDNDGTVSDSQAGVYIWNSADDEKQFYNCQVYGNIIYNAKVAAVSYSATSKSKGIVFSHNVFVAKDSLIRGTDKLGDVKYQNNNWWSVVNGFNMDGIKSLTAWAQKTGSELKDGKVIGSNIKPVFKDAGNAAITSASQLKTCYNYRLLNKIPNFNKNRD